MQFCDRRDELLVLNEPGRMGDVECLALMHTFDFAESDSIYHLGRG
ncbi:hypothetical protein KEJ49_02155 [Candidatus Bathyarchaeota archaeon]|nr:hypothetical protein [Candidatus Bathyarchaeota archaeon]